MRPRTKVLNEKRRPPLDPKIDRADNRPIQSSEVEIALSVIGTFDEETAEEMRSSVRDLRAEQP